MKPRFYCAPVRMEQSGDKLVAGLNGDTGGKVGRRLNKADACSATNIKRSIRFEPEASIQDRTR